MSMLAYKDKRITLSLGDKVVLTQPLKRNTTPSFLINSFNTGLCDHAELEVKQRPWLEFYFVLTMSKNARPVMNLNYISGRYETDYTQAPNAGGIYAEEVSYYFLRTMLDLGGVLKADTMQRQYE